MNYYSTVKRNELLTCAETWIDLRIIILGERNQTQKTVLCDSVYFDSRANV